MANILWSFKTHKIFFKNCKDLSELAKLVEFTKGKKWIYWEPIFMKYLHTVPGRNEIPIFYCIRDHNSNFLTPHTDFFYYIPMVMLSGETFAIVTADVYKYLVNFIAGN